MTREELKAHCEKQVEMCEMWAIGKGEKPSGKIYEEHKLILELLEQEPCEDAISRQAVSLNAVKDLFCRICMESNLCYRSKETCEDLRLFDELPPVNPTKTGHWIEERTYMECPNCHDIWHYEENQTERFKFCPTCGMRIK